MRLIDRSIARLYLTHVVLLLVIIFAFVLTIDLAMNLDKYLELASSKTGETSSWMHRALLALMLLIDLWWPRLAQLGNALLGLAMVGGAGFACAHMVKGRELVALLASGVSLWRVAAPIVAVSLGLTLLQALNAELLIPRLAPLLTRDINNAGARALGAMQLKPGVDGRGRVFSARLFDADRGVLEDLEVLERGERGLASGLIRARLAEWDGRVWRLTDGVAVDLNGLAPPRAVETLATDLDPVTLKLRRFDGYGQSLSWRQIGQLVSRPEVLGANQEAAQRRVEQLERLRFGRPALMVCNMLALIIALPFFLKREPGPMLLPALKAAPLAISALVAGVLATSAQVPGLPPQVSVFLPCLVLLPLAIASATSIRT